jgi:hypothetical protein
VLAHPLGVLAAAGDHEQPVVCGVGTPGVEDAALSPDCRLVLVDGKLVELGQWRLLRL